MMLASASTNCESVGYLTCVPCVCTFLTCTANVFSPTSNPSELVAYWKKHGSVADIQNDVKLRGWTFSVIRKLSINSSSLQGEKTRLIESHEGLKEHLSEKELVEAARADGDAASGARRSWGGGAGAEGEEEAKVEVEELVKDAEEKEEIV